MLDPDIKWTYCEICGGIILPFDANDRWLYDAWVNKRV